MTKLNKYFEVAINSIPIYINIGRRVFFYSKKYKWPLFRTIYVFIIPLLITIPFFIFSTFNIEIDLEDLLFNSQNVNSVFAEAIRENLESNERMLSLLNISPASIRYDVFALNNFKFNLKASEPKSQIASVRMELINGLDNPIIEYGGKRKVNVASLKIGDIREEILSYEYRLPLEAIKPFLWDNEDFVSLDYVEGHSSFLFIIQPAWISTALAYFIIFLSFFGLTMASSSIYRFIRYGEPFIRKH